MYLRIRYLQVYSLAQAFVSGFSPAGWPPKKKNFRTEKPNENATRLGALAALAQNCWDLAEATRDATIKHKARAAKQGSRSWQLAAAVGIEKGSTRCARNGRREEKLETRAERLTHLTPEEA